jgi:DNA polymerase-3 subunit beta
MSAIEFPELPVVEDGLCLMLPVKALTVGLGGSLFAASTDETKQILTGVHFKRVQDSLEFAATDGHRLAVVQAILENPETEANHNENTEEFAVTIPARALRELEKMLTSREETDLISVHFDESQIIFEIGNQHLTSRKLEGAYPAYQQLVPRQFLRQVNLDRKRLISSLELVAVLADQKNNIVKFSLDSDHQELTLSVEAKDVGSAKELMSAEISGDSIDIAFNVKYLMDGLKALPAGEIQMQLNENNQPVIFNPLGGLKMTYLVMPVQLRD